MAWAVFFGAISRYIASDWAAQIGVDQSVSKRLFGGFDGFFGDLEARIAPEVRSGLVMVLTRRSRGGPHLPDVTANDLMSPGVLSGPPNTPIVGAIQQMLAQKRKRFLIEDEEGKPMGMVDRQMLFRAVLGYESLSDGCQGGEK